MDLVGFNYFIHCSQLSVFFFFLNKKDFQSVHEFFSPTTAIVTFTVFVIIYLCSQWVPILGCTQNPGGKKRKSCHESQCRIK